jgi:hypothetical protein
MLGVVLQSSVDTPLFGRVIHFDGLQHSPGEPVVAVVLG